MIAVLGLKDQQLVALTSDPLSPAGIVRNDRLISDAQPLAVWAKYLIGWEEIKDEPYTEQSIETSLQKQANTKEYRTTWGLEEA